MKRLCALLMAVILIISCLPVEGYAAVSTAGKWTGAIANAFEGGSGTKEDPYYIATPEQLAYLAQQVNSGNNYSGKYISLISDIDLGQKEWTAIGASASTPFKGTFLGNGYTVTNLYQGNYNSSHLHGLFGYNSGTIMQLNLTNVDIFVAYNGRESAISQNSLVYVGAVVGYNHGSLSFVTATGSLYVEYSASEVRYWMELFMGGVVGGNDGSIANCYSYVLMAPSAYGYMYLGGLIGHSFNGTVTGSMAEGYIESHDTNGHAYCGGFVGGASKTTISNCLATADVSQTYQELTTLASAGFAASASESSFTNCMATGEVLANMGYKNSSANCVAAGMVAHCISVTLTGCVANNSSVAAIVQGGYYDAYAGRMTAYGDAKVNNCYYNSGMKFSRSVAVDGGLCQEDSYQTESSISNGATNGTAAQCDETLLFTTLGFGRFQNVADAIVNTDNVWRSDGNGITLFSDRSYLFSVTVRYILDDTGIYGVYTSYHGYGESVNVQSPTIYGYAPDISTLSFNYITESIKQDVIYTHSHINGEAATCHAPQICILCKEVIQPQLEHVPGPDATCTTNQVCILCGDELNAILPHNYDSTIINPGCTEMGYTNHVCVGCGLSYKDAYTAPVGHQFDEAAKDYVCTNCGESFGSKPIQYRVTVRDIESGNGIFAAQVTLGEYTGHTDSAGVCLFVLSSDEQRILKISAEGYPDYTVNNYSVSAVPSDTVYLEAGDTGIYAAYCNGKDVIAGQTQINTHAYDLEASFTISARAKANILRYEILQDGNVIATSESGTFTVPNGKFLREKDVYVRMYTDGAEGHNIYQRKLNIYTIGFNLDLQSDWDKLLPFTAGLTLEFPNGVPVLEGLKFNIPNAFGKGQGFGMELGNEKLIITFSEKSKASDVKKDIDNKTRDQILQELTKEWLGKKYSDGDRATTGSLALVIEFDKNGPTKAYGQLQLGFELEYEWSRTFVLWIIPLHANVQANLDGGLLLDEIGYDFENDQILIPDLNFKLNGMVYASLGVGCRVLSAGIYGQLKTELQIELLPDPKIENFLISGEMGAYLRVKILFWKAMEYRHTFLRGTYQYPDPNGYSMPNMYSLSGYKDASRDYLENRGPWMGTQTYSEGGASLQALQNTSYQGIEPQIVRCGDTTMMLFMDDDGSEGKNYQQLYFSLYDASTGVWGEPKKVNDDLLAEVEFDVCSDGNDIYLLYTQSAEITAENQEDYDAITCAMEVMAAKYDPVAGCFVEHTNISRNTNYDSNPRITVDAGTVHAAWISNPTGDVFAQNANNIIYTASFTNDGWTAAAPLTQMGATVTSMDIGVLGQSVHIALVRDLDCDLQTADDRVADLLSLAGVETRLKTDDYDNDGVRFSALNGKNVMTWINSGNIYCVAAPDAEPEMLLQQGVEGLDGDYRVCQVDDATWAVFYTRIDETTDTLGNSITGSDVYGVFCQNGQWGKPVRVTRTEKDAYIDAFDAVMIDQQLVVPYLSTRTVFSKDSFSATSSFMSTKIELGYDIVVSEAGASVDQLLEGDDLQINALVTNNSWQAVDSVHVQVGDSAGNIVLSEIVDIQIDTGATEIINVKLDKAKLIPDAEYLISVIPVGHGDTDSDNNTKQLTLWYTDLKVDAKQELLPGNKLQLSYAVSNGGNTSGGGTVQIYKLVGEEKTVLHTQKLDSLKPNQTHSGQVEITDSFYDNGSTGTVYVSVIPERADLYSFNDVQSLYVGGLQYNATEEVEQEQVLELPVLDKSYVCYDPVVGGSIAVAIEEKGYTFQQIEGVDASAYTYENAVLTISESWLQSQINMHRYLYLDFVNGSKTVQVLLVIEIQNNALSNPNMTVNAPATVKFDGKVLEINRDFRVITPSQGALHAEFSIDGMFWHEGLPVLIGDYMIRITQDTDVENHYAAAECCFNISIIKGGRGISVPNVLEADGLQIRFGNATPTAGIGDGEILYGYSTQNNPASVETWATEGILPQTSGLQTYYIFAKITEGENYEEAISLGVLAQAHVHSYRDEVVPPDCVTEGYTLHECTCGDSYKDTYKEAVGHMSVTDPAVEPDCINTGLTEGSHCQTCGAVLVAQQVIPEKGHSYQALFDQNQHYEECLDCNDIRNAAEHVFENACDTDCVCGYTRNTEHLFSDKWSSNGMTHWHECAVCSAKQDETPHDFDNGCDTDCGICGFTRTTEHLIDYNKIGWNDTEHYRICLECFASLDVEKHTFDNACDTTCNGCNFTRSIEHTYDDSCDSVCNICSYVRAITHSFSTSWSANSKHHWHRCLVCNYPSDVQEHSYDNACDGTCNVCGWRRSIEHDYQSVWFSNDDNHWHTCSVCGDITDMQQHIYDNTCDNSCNLCGHTRQIVHMYETQWINDTINHWRVCEICGDVADKTAHAFDNTCDTDCNICGYVRQITHDYSRIWDYDAQSHWYTCQICGDITDRAEHIFDNACDADCNICGKSREIVHDFSTKWSSNADCHWYACLVCGEQTGKQSHIHDNACDADCNVCGQIRETVHNYSGDWSTDTDSHWYTCVVCGDITEKEEHDYDNACDTHCNVCSHSRITSHTYDGFCDGECNICGDKRTAPHSYDEKWTGDEMCHWHQCSSCGVRKDEAEHQWEGYSCSVCGQGKAIRGDVDSNDVVNDADAIYLLRHTLFPDVYTLNQSGDMNGDGEVNDKDAVYLLRHTLFPIVYPLS